MMNMRCSAWALLQRNEAAKAAAAATQGMISANATQSTDGGMEPAGLLARRLSRRLSRRGALDGMCRLDHCALHERTPRLRHLPGDYSLASNAGCGRLFLIPETQTRPASRPVGVRVLICAGL